MSSDRALKNCPVEFASACSSTCCACPRAALSVPWRRSAGFASRRGHCWNGGGGGIFLQEESNQCFRAGEPTQC